jgi:hypothetical protein
MRTPVSELYTAFRIPYIYDYITKLCRQQAEDIRNRENANIRNIGQGESRHRKHKTLKLGGGQAYDSSGDQTASKLGITYSSKPGLTEVLYIL